MIAALDARRGQVYWAAFDLKTHARLTPDAAAPVAEAAAFAQSCKKPVFYVGDGAALCYNRDEQALPCHSEIARAVRRARAWPAGLCTWPGRAFPLPR